MLRVGFDRAEIVRLLDEMPISTETDTPNIGLVRDQLAYEVTGSAFWAQQSDALNLILLGLDIIASSQVGPASMYYRSRSLPSPWLQNR
jgi:hypothetical protein